MFFFRGTRKFAVLLVSEGLSSRIHLDPSFLYPLQRKRSHTPLAPWDSGGIWKRRIARHTSYTLRIPGPLLRLFRPCISGGQNITQADRYFTSSCCCCMVHSRSATDSWWPVNERNSFVLYCWINWSRRTCISSPLFHLAYIILRIYQELLRIRCMHWKHDTLLSGTLLTRLPL